MKSLLLVYSTLTGFTQNLSQELYEDLKRDYPKFKIEIINIGQLTDKKTRASDLIVIIASTTGDGDVNYDAEDFLNNLDNMNLSYISFLLYGIGDRTYPNFCGAIDKIHDKILVNKGKILNDILKFDSFNDQDIKSQIKKSITGYLT